VLSARCCSASDCSIGALALGVRLHAFRFQAGNLRLGTGDRLIGRMIGVIAGRDIVDLRSADQLQHRKQQEDAEQEQGER